MLQSGALHGSFIVKNPTSTYTKNRIVFAIAQKVRTPLDFIKEKLGIGTVTFETRNNIFRYEVNRLNEIPILINLFNGNLVLSKVFKRFQIWVDNYNQVAKTASQEAKNAKTINVLLDQKQVSLSNCWLSEFAQADGGFNVSLRRNEKSKFGHWLQFKIYFTQKDEENFLSELAVLIRNEDPTNEERKPLKVYVLKKKENTFRVDFTKH